MFSTLHDLIICLNDVVSKLRGHTILYIPFEGFVVEKSSCSKKTLLYTSDDFEKQDGKKEEDDEKEFNNQLEKIACTWIKQIREALIALPIVEKELRDIKDEFDYWNHKCSFHCLSCYIIHKKSRYLLNHFFNFQMTI